MLVDVCAGNMNNRRHDLIGKAALPVAMPALGTAESDSDKLEEWSQSGDNETPRAFHWSVILTKPCG